MGGLRFMVTGGEPLLYPRFAELNRILAGRPYRRVLITNGTLMGMVDYAALNFHEIQFSLDGLEGGHDFLRGPGNFARTTQAMLQALDAGMDVSVATVMHARNLGELAELGSRLEEMGVMSWTLEYPVPEGRLRDEPEIMPDLAAAVPLMEMEWGSGMHEGAAGYACGAHLASILPTGQLVKCDYYADLTGGDVGEGLRRAWEALPKAKIRGSCAACEVLVECGGGCRYRALLLAGEEGPDPVMCLRQGRPA
jgi:radical SAM protein with 4Fe4S-binding SPASM domain